MSMKKKTAPKVPKQKLPLWDVETRGDVFQVIKALTVLGKDVYIVEMQLSSRTDRLDDVPDDVWNCFIDNAMDCLVVKKRPVSPYHSEVSDLLPADEPKPEYSVADRVRVAEQPTRWAELEAERGKLREPIVQGSIGLTIYCIPETWRDCRIEWKGLAIDCLQEELPSLIAALQATESRLSRLREIKKKEDAQ